MVEARTNPAELLVQHYERLLNYAKTLVPVDDAQDIVQKVALKTLNPDRAYQKVHNGYLFQAIKNGVVDHIRSNHRHSAASLDQEIENSDGDATISQYLVDPDITPEQYAVRMDDLRPLSTALSQLPPKQGQAVILRYIDGLDYQEIAETMNIPIGTVRSSINRGMRKLRENPNIIRTS